MQNEPSFHPTRELLPPCFLVGDTDASADPLPDVPILLSTRLQLELLLQESALDLRAVSAVILEDLGATLQILRLVGEEFGCEEERPIRIEDCIACLDTRTWFEAVSAVTLEQNSRAADAWQHARQIGRYAEQLAGQEDDLRPGEARLVGLLHEIGRLPELLGWQRPAGGQENRTFVATMLAEHWHLPGCILDAGGEDQASPSASQWTVILRAAHACAQQEDASNRRKCEAATSCA